MPKLLTRAFVLLTAGHFLQALGYATMMMLPLYLDHLGASRSEVGAIMAASAVGGLLFRPAVGWALDTLGRRPTLAAGTVVLALSMGAIGLVDQIGPLIYGVRFAMGIGVGALFTGYFTFAADIIPTSRRTEGIALFGVSGLLPLALNPFVDGAGVQPEDLRWFYPIVGVVIASSMLCVWKLKEPQVERSPGGISAREVFRALRQPGLWPVWMATVVFSALVATFMAFSTVSAEDRGVGHATALWFTYAGGAVAVRLFGARLPDKIGTTNMIAPALGLYAVAMLLAASAHSTEAFMIAGGLAGLGHGYCFPVVTSQVVSRAPEHLRGSALSMFTAIWEISSLGLTPLFGLVADLRGDAVMFASVAVFACVGLGVWALIEGFTSRASARPSP